MAPGGNEGDSKRSALNSSLCYLLCSFNVRRARSINDTHTALCIGAGLVTAQDADGVQLRLKATRSKIAIPRVLGVVDAILGERETVSIYGSRNTPEMLQRAVRQACKRGCNVF